MVREPRSSIVSTFVSRSEIIAPRIIFHSFSRYSQHVPAHCFQKGFGLNFLHEILQSKPFGSHSCQPHVAEGGPPSYVQNEQGFKLLYFTLSRQEDELLPAANLHKLALAARRTKPRCASAASARISGHLLAWSQTCDMGANSLLPLHVQPANAKKAQIFSWGTLYSLTTFMGSAHQNGLSLTPGPRIMGVPVLHH